jgi:hypothetical protein
MIASPHPSPLPSPPPQKVVTPAPVKKFEHLLQKIVGKSSTKCTEDAALKAQAIVRDFSESTVPPLIHEAAKGYRAATGKQLETIRKAGERVRRTQEEVQKTKALAKQQLSRDFKELHALFERLNGAMSEASSLAEAREKENAAAMMAIDAAVEEEGEAFEETMKEIAEEYKAQVRAYLEVIDKYVN